MFTNRKQTIFYSCGKMLIVLWKNAEILKLNERYHGRKYLIVLENSEGKVPFDNVGLNADI